jgi:DUF4097 and DUF4098 domain-containing protein YvlB
MNIKYLIIAGLLGTAAAGKAHAADRDFEQKIAASANGTVEISNVAGSLDISGWDRAEVAVQGQLGDGVERVDVTGSASRIYVKVILKRSAHDGDASLTISVPKGSEVSASAVSASIDSKGVVGRQRLTTVSGSIAAEIDRADSQMKTVSGDIELRGTQQPMDLRLSTVSGSLRVERGAGEVEATSVSGDVNLDVNPAHSVRLHSTSGDLEFTGQLTKGGSLEAETVSGEVSLHARAQAGYEYEASSFAGDIDSCFGKKPERTEPHGPGSRLNGTVGDASGRVRVKSMSGDISICDK